MPSNASPVGPTMTRRVQRVGPTMTRQTPSQQQPASEHVRKQAEVKDQSCIDDPTWVDQDGDGCAAYAKHIQNNEISQSEACEYSDGAAKLHCPATCGLCKQKPGLLGSLFGMLGSMSESAPEVNPSSIVRLEAAKHPHVEAPSELEKVNEPCKDDPDWVDADGDNCAVYADHIASKLLTQDEACMYGNGNARDHCRVTCGTCIRNEDLSKEKISSASAPIPSPHWAPVSPKLVPAPSGPMVPPSPAPHKETCADDPEWKDQDGDGCTVYAARIQADEVSLDEACSYQEEAAKRHCPMTCNMCSEKTTTPTASPTIASPEEQKTCMDDLDWVDQDGDGCVAYATAIKAGSITQAEACDYSDGKAKERCPVTCDMCPPTASSPVHQNLSVNTKPKPPTMTPRDPNTSIVKQGACIDDPDWVDQDGDNCAAYAKAIKEGHTTQVEACGYSSGDAKQHCLVTCNSCPRIHSSQQKLPHSPPSTEASKATQFV